MDMHMSYYFSSTVHDFLFSGVNVITTWGMISLCVGLASLSVLAEGFKVGRSQLMKIATSRRSGCSQYKKTERLKFHIVQSFLHMIHIVIGYILMLVVMTYNAYFTITVVGGAGIGYFFFAVFDLPSKVLGASPPSPAKLPNSSCTQGAEGNSSSISASYGATGVVSSSSVVLRPSSELEQYACNNDSVDLACDSVGTSLIASAPGQSGDIVSAEAEVLVGGSVGDGSECEQYEVDTSDTSRLLPQETIKVEVQVHAFPDKESL